MGAHHADQSEPAGRADRRRGARDERQRVVQDAVAHRAHHEEVRPRQDLTPCPSRILPAPHHRSSLLSMQPPEFAIDPEHWAYLPASCTSIPPRAYPPASTPSDTSYLTKVVYI